MPTSPAINQFPSLEDFQAKFTPSVSNALLKTKFIVPLHPPFTGFKVALKMQIYLDYILYCSITH